MKKNVFPIVFVIALFLCVYICVQQANAETDLSLSPSDVSFSTDNPLEGTVVRVFARIFNVGSEDAYGLVSFWDNGEEIAQPQPISVRINTYDDVFIDWIAAQGSHEIEAKIVDIIPGDDNSVNDSAVKEDVFVDIDTDSDGIGDNSDSDDDGDGLVDEIEKKIGTNALIADTDGDGVKDAEDIFPLDPREDKDSDNDGVGNNADEDDDNDGLKDEEELWIYETNPLKVDSDEDEISDGQEVQDGTSPLKSDSDGDGVLDIRDKFPLDPSRAQASIFDMAMDFLKDKGISSNRFLAGGCFVLFVIFFIMLLRRRRGRG